MEAGILIILILLVVNLIVGVLNYNKQLSQADIEDAIHNVLFIE